MPNTKATDICLRLMMYGFKELSFLTLNVAYVLNQPIKYFISRKLVFISLPSNNSSNSLIRWIFYCIGFRSSNRSWYVTLQVGWLLLSWAEPGLFSFNRSRSRSGWLCGLCFSDRSLVRIDFNFCACLFVSCSTFLSWRFHSSNQKPRILRNLSGFITVVTSTALVNVCPALATKSIQLKTFVSKTNSP